MIPDKDKIVVEDAATRENKRRIKAVQIPEEEIGICLARKLKMPEVIDLPEDAELVGIHQDWLSQTVTFMYRHPSFEPVLEGAMAPLLDRRMMRMDPKAWSGTWGSAGGEE